MKNIILKFMDKLGGRKMTIFLLCYATITSVFIFSFPIDDIVKYGETLFPYVLALVVGNVGEHFAKK